MRLSKIGRQLFGVSLTILHDERNSAVWHGKGRAKLQFQNRIVYRNPNRSSGLACVTSNECSSMHVHTTALQVQVASKATTSLNEVPGQLIFFPFMAHFFYIFVQL